MGDCYLDQSSTSLPKPPEVACAISRFLLSNGANIGRGVYSPALEGAEEVLAVRRALAGLLGLASPESHVIFTAGATASMNFVLKGLLRPGDHFLFSAIEHNDVLRPARQLENCGVSHTVLPCSADGLLCLDEMEAALTPSTRAFVLSHASNVAGTLQPACEVGRFCRERGLFFILDVAQTAGCLPIDMARLGADALVVSGHKGLLGPQGVGALLLSQRIAPLLEPLIAGGTGSASDSADMPAFLPDRLEAGTLNLPGIIGLGAGLAVLGKEGPEKERAHELALCRLFLSGLSALPDIAVRGPKTAEERVGIVSVEPAFADPAEVAFLLSEKYGVFTRAGLHCAPLAHRALGSFPRGTVRFSFGRATTEEEVAYALFSLKAVLKEVNS